MSPFRCSFPNSDSPGQTRSGACVRAGGERFVTRTTPGRGGAMGILDRFEKGLENVVNGAFAKAFRSQVEPVE
ncbi:MAG: FhaA domain-containing protein, partial [Brevibacterium aurantiacum]